MAPDKPDPWVLHRRRIEAAAATLQPGSMFSHTSAALIHGLPLLSGRYGVVDVIRTNGGHGEITETMHARSATLDADEIADVDGLPVTSLARTATDLIRQLPFMEAVMVADAALLKGETLENLLARTAQGRGCRMAAAVLAFADGRAESPGESISRVKIHKAGLPIPDLQRNLHDANGEFLARTDFWWEGHRLAGEFDGIVKYEALVPEGKTVADVIRAEKRREQALRDEGIEVIRWTWDDLWHPGCFVDRIRQTMARLPHR